MKLLSLVLLLLFTNPGKENVSSESLTVDFYGTVIEEISGEPLPGAMVSIKEVNKEVYTDFNGNFSVEDIRPGEYSIEVTYTSFETKEVKDLRVAPDSNSVVITLY